MPSDLDGLEEASDISNDDQSIWERRMLHEFDFEQLRNERSSDRADEDNWMSDTDSDLTTSSYYSLPYSVPIMHSITKRQVVGRCNVVDSTTGKMYLVRRDRVHKLKMLRRFGYSHSRRVMFVKYSYIANKRSSKLVTIVPKVMKNKYRKEVNRFKVVKYTFTKECYNNKNF